MRDVREGGYACVKDGSDAKGTHVSIRETRLGEVRYFDVTLKVCQNGDYLFSCVYALPLAEGSVVFSHDLRHDETLSSDTRECIVGEAVPCGSGRLSKWPVATARVGQQEYALDLDMQSPAFFHFGANARYRCVSR